MKSIFTGSIASEFSAMLLAWKCKFDFESHFNQLDSDSSEVMWIGDCSQDDDKSFETSFMSVTEILSEL